MRSGKSFKLSSATSEQDLALLQDPVFVREIQVSYRGARRVKTSLRGAEAIANFTRKVLPDNSRQHFVAFYLNAASCVIAYSIVGTGIADKCPVHPREVFQGAILVGAVYVAVAHNVPSNSTKPSYEDMLLTRRLKEAGYLLRIHLDDHVIVTDKEFHAISERDFSIK